MSDVDFLGVVEPSDSARADADALGFRTWGSIDELLRFGADAVILSVPTALHYELALKCIDASCGMLIEKPIAMDSASGAAIISAAKSKAVPLMVGYVERYNPAVVAIRNFMAQGGLGRIFTISARRVGVMPARIRDANVLIDIGVHDIDLVAFITGTELDLRSALGGRAVLQDRIDYALLSLDAGGIAVDITSNWLTPVKIRELFVTGENGLCHVDYITQKARFAAARPLEPLPDFESVVAQYVHGEFADLPVEKGEPLRRELEVFVAGLRGAAFPDPSIALVSLRIAEAATREIESTAQSFRLSAVPA
jgi:UDP-N-acetylglucosamine 3-dehydrogenase